MAAAKRKRANSGAAGACQDISAGTLALAQDHQVDEVLMPNGPQFLSADLQSHFYQKFENEQEGKKKTVDDLSKREKMLELMRQGGWSLEVSLKHSGSLGHFDGEIVWAKNSVDNHFTAAFENLLFDCFRRAQPLTVEGNERALKRFQSFCSMLKNQRISLAFEGVCREMLGDHGQLPRFNYLVVTAVVDRAKPHSQRFRDTRGVIEFCTEWELPWNETFLFSTSSSFEKYWNTYDQLGRNGSADEIITALQKAADVYFPCPVPHLEVQGDILEGMVARIVPYNDTAELQHKAHQVLAALPFDRLATLSGELDKVWIDAGNVCQHCKQRESLVARQTKFVQLAKARVGTGAFQGILTSSLAHPATERIISRMISQFEQVSGTADVTTRQVVGLLRKIWVPKCAENSKNLRSKCKLKGYLHTNGDVMVIVQVLGDYVFHKVNSKLAEDDMPLYRGLVFRVSCATDHNQSRTVGAVATRIEVAPTTPVHLMVKCKTVQYKIMTFILRKGATLFMKLLSQNPSNQVQAKRRYEDNAEYYWRQWATSESELTEFRERYSSFVIGWVDWLQDKVNSGKISPAEFVDQQSYLGLVAEYKADATVASDGVGKPFRGIIFVTYPATQVPTDPSALHHAISNRFGRLNVVTLPDIKEISRGALRSLVQKAVVVPVAMACRCPPRDFAATLAGYASDVAWVSGGLPSSCMEMAELAQLGPVATKAGVRKRFQNIAPKWCRTLATVVPPTHRFLDESTKNLIEWPLPLTGTENLNSWQQCSMGISQQGGGDGAALTKAIVLLEPERKRLTRAKTTCVIFPCIPGCGKTSLLQDSTLKELRTKLGQLKQNPEVIIIDGDNPKERSSFWRRLDERIAARLPYVEDGGRDSIYICDKNCPPGLIHEDSGTDGLHRQIAQSKDPDSTSMVFIVPHSTGYVSPSGTANPFCLALLAVCIQRVIHRPMHYNLKGPSSPSVLAKFHNIYDKTNRNMFLNRMKRLGKVIELPVLTNDSIDVASDLADCLEVGKDLARIQQPRKTLVGDQRAPSADVEAWNQSISELLEKYKARVDEWQTNVDVVAENFVSGLHAAIVDPICLASAAASPRYCGVFLDPTAVRECAEACGVPQVYLSDPLDIEDTSTSPVWVADPHVTLCHVQEVTEPDQVTSLAARFSGKMAQVHVDAAFVRSDGVIAALRVKNIIIAGQYLCLDKDFLHITLWVGHGASAVESNLLSTHNAVVYSLESEPMILTGNVCAK